MKPVTIIVSLVTAVAGGAAGYFVGKGSVESAAPEVNEIKIVRGTKSSPGSGPDGKGSAEAKEGEGNKQ